jgi:Family of unknown function (DUF5681)
MTPSHEHKSDGTNDGDYAVGKCRPPTHTRWQRGQSGNPSGRPKGRLNLNTEIKELLRKKVTIRDGGTERKLSLPAANILAHGIKGAKGDARSTGLFLNYLDQKGLLEERVYWIGRGRASGHRRRGPPCPRYRASSKRRLV